MLLGYLLEMLRRGTSNVYPQHVLRRNKKKYQHVLVEKILSGAMTVWNRIIERKRCVHGFNFFYPDLTLPMYYILTKRNGVF